MSLGMLYGMNAIFGKHASAYTRKEKRMHNIVTMGIKAPQIWFDEDTKREDYHWDEAERQKYKAREIEMCIDARKAEPALKKPHTLFSQETWDVATRALFNGLAEGS